MVRNSLVSFPYHRTVLMHVLICLHLPALVQMTHVILNHDDDLSDDHTVKKAENNKPSIWVYDRYMSL
jgi:hypothetical protein